MWGNQCMDCYGDVSWSYWQGFVCILDVFLVFFIYLNSIGLLTLYLILMSMYAIVS